MATKVSVINMKGGVGKSTIAVNLAWHFAAYGAWSKRVLLVDLDPQFNASQYLLGVTAYERIIKGNEPTVWDVFEQGTRTPAGKAPTIDAGSVIVNHKRFRGGGCIDLVPSRLELALSLKSAGRKERNLARLISDVEGAYDLVLIDCAPTESMLTTAAYLTSDWLLVPVKPEYLSTIGLPLLVSSMDDFKSEYPDAPLALAGIVFNAATEYLPEEAIAKTDVRRIAKKNGWYVFRAQVDYSRSYPKGAREGLPIFRTSYSRWTKVQNFASFANELAGRIGL